MAEKKLSPHALPPLEVHPLLKLLRWSCLLGGMIYGFVKRREYAAIQKAIREQDEIDRPARKARLLEEKLNREAAEMEELRKHFASPEKEPATQDKSTMTEEMYQSDRETDELLDKQKESEA